MIKRVFRFASIRVIRGLILSLFCFVCFAARAQGLPPRITTQPTNQIVVTGSDVRFVVETAASATPLRLQWKIGNANIPNATNSVLNLTNVQTTAAADYFVNVANTAGSLDSQIARLGIAGVKGQSVSLGADVAFVVSASGFTATGFRWQFNGADMAGATQSSYKFVNARVADAGDYSVVVTHSTGSITLPAILDVDPAFTKITAGPIVNDPAQLSIGTAWADFNKDGYLDLVIAGGSDSTFQKNLLYQNNRDGTFTKITNGPVAQELGISAGATWADYDNDDFIDLIVAHSPGQQQPFQQSALYRNLDGNSFQNVTTTALGPSVSSFSTAVWGDYDNDGWLDLYLPGRDGLIPYLYRNAGNGTFTRITQGPQVTFSARTQGASWADYDGDGFLDLFVFRPEGKNLLFHNNADGSFTRIIAGEVVNDPAFSKGAAWGDYDNDGFLDLFVSNGDFAGGKFANFLYHNNRDGSFTRITTGIIASDRGDSTRSAWEDFDNDGNLDLFVPHYMQGTSVPNNDFYRNNGDGTFTKIITGSLVNDRGHANGAAWGDYNRDGFPDLVVPNYGERNLLYLNNTNSNNWITFNCSGRISNRSAIGANVRVKAVLNPNLNPNPTWQLRVISNGDGFAGNSLEAHFGLRDATIIDTVRIEWPSGIVQELRNVAPRQFLTVTEEGVAIVPRVANLVAGSNHVFTAKATFGGALSYQWRFNGADIAGATSASYTVANTGSAAAGSYSVIVRDPAGVVLAVSSESPLRLPGPPVITAQPQNQIVASGADLTLSVETLPSNTPLRYEWYKDGSRVAGPSLPILLVTNVTLANGGNYTALIYKNLDNGDLSNMTSARAAVTVIQDKSVSSSLGGNATLRFASGGSPLTNVQWRINGVDIPGATLANYVITNAQPSDVGQYSLLVENAFGSFTNFVHPLIVDPTFTKITTGAIATDRAAAGGAAWADYDNDGNLDLVVANGAGSSNQKNFLYRNNADRSFARVTEGILPATSAQSFGAAWGDYDNDGFADLYLPGFRGSSAGVNFLYRNLGGTNFQTITGINVGIPSSDFGRAVWGDYNLDGWLDLFVPNTSGKSLFYQNNTNGSFSSIAAGPAAFVGNSWASTWADYDNDGFPDLFVFNFPGKNFLFRNNANGGFTKIENGAIVADSASSLGGAWGDYDNDGFLDLFVANGDFSGGLFKNFLYHNDGNGTFTKMISSDLVADQGSSVTASWADFDNDGQLDLFVSHNSARGAIGVSNALYRNNGDGTFAKQTTGSLVNDIGRSNAGAWGDYDNDGFLDLFVSNYVENNLQNNFLYRNNGNGNNWIKFHLDGRVSNRSGIGAKVRLKATIQGRTYWQMREVSNGDGNSGSSLDPHFGLGDAKIVDTVRIEWLSGIVQEMHNVAAKQFLTVTEPVLVVGPKSYDFAGGVDTTFIVLTYPTGFDNFQWRLNGVNLQDETKETLTVRPTTASSAGRYTVLVKLPSGDTVESAAGVIKPPVPPTIGTQPAGATVDPGSEARFAVAASGSAPLTYQWRLNGEAVAGATNATFIVTNAGPEAAGEYSVEVRNAAGSVTSAEATLTLVGAPTVSPGLPKDQSVSVGATVTFNLSVGGSAPRSYQWLLNGAAIAGATNRLLAITNVTLANSGQRYQFVVRNSLGSAMSREARIDVDAVFTKINSDASLKNANDPYGVSWGDYDNDGFLDLLVGRSLDSPGSFYYHNKGDGTFEAITTPLLTPGTWGGIWADYDNDGNLDLFLANCCETPNALYHNMGAGTFAKEVSGSFNLDNDTSSAAWADIDNDGYLDLLAGGRLGTKVRLYRNHGDGNFAQIAAGLLANVNGATGVSWGDYDNDGREDFFVANGVDPLLPTANRKNLLFRNNGAGEFGQILDGDVVNDLNASIGGFWADYDNDGYLDLFVANGRGLKSVLYRNNRDGTFARISTGDIANVGSTYTAAWGDYDCDGHIDLFVTNAGLDTTGSFAGQKSNFLYHNNGDGSFVRITTGSPANDLGNCIGAAWGDMDNDGFLDLFVTNHSGENEFYRNGGNANGWIKFRCVGTFSNRSAIGAKVRVKAVVKGKQTWQLREISGGGGSGSQNELNPHFGLGDATIVDIVRVEWPSGAVQEFYNLPAKQFLTVTEPPRLSGVVRNADGSVRLNLIGAVGIPFSVEASNDLVKWTPLVTLTNRTRIEMITDTQAAGAASRFYRATGPGPIAFPR